jgi:hypothetical protein
MRIRTALLIAGAGYAGYRFALRPWRDGWGFDPVDAGAPLPGDDLVLAPDHVETRGIDIAAPPEAVWPWLVQMGFGRAGWYSYDQLDMEGGSASDVRPDLQELAVGDILPTHPGGGFVVRELDPGRSLVLYMDDGLIDEQAKAAKAKKVAVAPANLQASGAFLSATTSPRFVASWAFVLEPRGSGTRLIERFRVVMQGGGAGSRIGAPALGFGVFLMTRKQMLGIRDRVEGRTVPVATPVDAPVPAAPTEPVEPIVEPEQAGPLAAETLVASPA